MAGLTDTGIVIKDVDEIIAGFVAFQLANIDADLNTESDSVVGQLNGVVGAALAELWELLEQVYQAAYPDTASNQPLSYIAALTGAVRAPATHATLLVHLEGTVTTSVPAGTTGYVDGDADSLWETTSVAVIAEEGTPDFVEVTMQAVDTGPETTAHSADIELVISTPVAGLDAITIQADYVAGASEETDSELRTRRQQLLALPGSTTVAAIRAAVLLVTGVDSCTVFENPTGIPNALGMPPKSIEVLIYSNAAPDYDAQDVVDAILLHKPGGTQTFGGLSGTAADSTGNTYTVYYSEPDTVDVYIDLTLTAATDGTYVGNASVETAIADWGSAALRVGQSIYASDIVNVVVDLEGVVNVDVSTVRVDDVASPATVDLTLTARQLGIIDSANVGVTS